MPQEFFIDASAAGTGSGDTPTDAFTGLLNFTDAASLPSSYDFGSKVWIRTTHVDCLGASGALAGYQARMFCGPNGQVVNMKTYQAKCHFIGWPASGDPFYDERPAAGVSAGWDSDVSSSILAGSYGWNYPLITSSHNSFGLGYNVDHRTGVYNLAFAMDNKAVVTKTVFDWDAGFVDGAIFDNIFVEGVRYFDYGTISANIRKITVVASYNGSAGPIWQMPISARHLVVHSMSVNPDGIIGDLCWIDLIENYSNSLAYVGAKDTAGINIPYYRSGYIGRITGIEPYSSDISMPFWYNLLPNDETKVIIQDYFGKGPSYSQGEGSRNTFLASSANAMYDGERVMAMDVRSWSVTHQYQRGLFYDQEPVIVRNVDVVSGQLYNIVFPFYQVQSAHNFAGAQIEVAVPFQGGGNFQGIGSSSIKPGSLSNWSGTYVSGGSAWQGEFNFIAKESATGTIKFFGSIPIAVSTNAWDEEFRLFGEPAVNSAS